MPLNILQNFIDCFDCDYSAKKCRDKKRLSWQLIDHHGGWRLGNLNGWNAGNWYDNHRKIIFLS